MYTFALYEPGYNKDISPSPTPRSTRENMIHIFLLVEMNGAWHHSVLYSVANYSGMATRTQVLTELCVYTCDSY